jgi:hypothetical protein
VTAFTLGGCATTYRTKHLQKDSNKIAHKINQQADGFIVAYNQRLAAYRVVQKSGMTGVAKQLNPEMKTMKAANDYIQLSRAEIVKQNNAVQTATNGNKVVREQDPGFPVIQSYQTYMKKMNDLLPGKGEEFNQAAQRFDKILSDNKIIMTDFNAIQKMFVDQDANLNKSISQARKRLAKSQADNTQHRPQIQEYRRSIMDRMSQILLTLEKMSTDMKKVINDLAAQYPQKGHVTITPNMPAARYVGDLRATAQEMTTLAEEFNTLSQKI